MVHRFEGSKVLYTTSAFSVIGTCGEPEKLERPESPVQPVKEEKISIARFSPLFYRLNFDKNAIIKQKREEHAVKQSVSHYMMPGDKEEDIRAIVCALGLDGIENLIYGEVPAAHPVPGLTVGCHLAYWPVWMNFYLGKKEWYEKDFPTIADRKRVFGGETVEEWLRKIRNNIRAALVEKPAYLVWHVADCRNVDIWTREFQYTNREILAKTAELYGQVADEIPSTVEVLFENIFWPGLYDLKPEEVDYFFSLLPGKNVGIMLDTGHLMNTNIDLETEAEAADFVCQVVKHLGTMKSLIRGIHLSCSLSGAYQKATWGKVPKTWNAEIIGRHIISIDQHRPFTTDAARHIVETVEPEYLTHELFGKSYGIPVEEVKRQLKALGIMSNA